MRWAIPDMQNISEFLSLFSRPFIRLLDGLPRRTVEAHHVTVSDTSNPLPLPVPPLQGIKPTRTKACIGHDNLRAPVRQLPAHLTEKALMDPATAQPATRMHFLIQRDSTPLDSNTRSQQVPPLVFGQRIPIHHDQQWPKVIEPMTGKAAVHLECQRRRAHRHRHRAIKE